MNIDTGHLVTEEKLENLTDKSGYVEVPEELKGDALKALKGAQEATVNLKGNTPLSKWSKEERKRRKKKDKEDKRKQKNKKKTAQGSKKVNRKK